MIVLLSKLFSVNSSIMGKFKRHLSYGLLQSRQAQQVVGGTDHVGVQLHASHTAKARASKSAPALHPAEDLLDPFALALTDSVTGVPSGPCIQTWRATALDLSQVRSDPSAAQESNERLVVIPFVASRWLAGFRRLRPWRFNSCAAAADSVSNAELTRMSTHNPLLFSMSA